MVARIQVALFDMAGTTVDDIVKIPGVDEKLPLIISAYEGAFKKGRIEMSFDELNDCRGKNKIDVFREKVATYRTDLSPDDQRELAQSLHDNEFVPALLEKVPHLREMLGTTEVFRVLKDRVVYVATGSGFPQVVTDAINDKLGWREAGLVDFGTCGSAVGGGRPKPNMINATLVAAGKLPQGTDLSQRVDGFDYSILVKVGDTVADVKEGLGVGATTIAVASGTQSREKLAAAGPLVVLPSVREVPSYLARNGYLD